MTGKRGERKLGGEGVGYHHEWRGRKGEGRRGGEGRGREARKERRSACLSHHQRHHHLTLEEDAITRVTHTMRDMTTIRPTLSCGAFAHGCPHVFVH